MDRVTPPPWMPTPDKPPNITPPTDFEPPTGELPDEYEGEMEPPPCPPPVIRKLDDAEMSDSLQPAPQYSRRLAFRVPNSAAYVEGYVNFTNWQASEVRVRLEPSDGGTVWQESQPGNVGLLQTSPVEKTSFRYTSYEVENGNAPKPGNYTLLIEADLPISGDVSSIFAVALPCGGLLE